MIEIPHQFASAGGDELQLSGKALLDLTGAVLSKGMSIRFKARGWSMSPFILDGDVVTVAKYKNCKPRMGDVVAFKRPGDGHLVMHRIVARYGNKYLIVGDNISNKPDGAISLEDMLGRIVSVHRASRPIWLGLGPERFLIAWLSKRNLLIPVLNLISSFRGQFLGVRLK
ncbi:MAG: S26 family signal peptidase [Desulfotignum sp.]|nr:S26 family signal peptidase [Desulfotignum sp.]